MQTEQTSRWIPVLLRVFGAALIAAIVAAYMHFSIPKYEVDLFQALILAPVMAIIVFIDVACIGIAGELFRRGRVNQWILFCLGVVFGIVFGWLLVFLFNTQQADWALYRFPSLHILLRLSSVRLFLSSFILIAAIIFTLFRHRFTVNRFWQFFTIAVMIPATGLALPLLALLYGQDIAQFSEMRIELNEALEKESVARKEIVTRLEQGLREAIASRNIDGCTPLKQYKNNCIIQIATAERDATLCKRVTDQYDRDNCLRVVAVEIRDPLLCTKIKDSEASDRCLMAVSQTNLDMRICDEIKNLKQGRLCRDMIETRQKIFDDLKETLPPEAHDYLREYLL